MEYAEGLRAAGTIAETETKRKRSALKEAHGTWKAIAIQYAIAGVVGMLCGRVSGLSVLPCAVAFPAAVMGREKAGIYLLFPVLAGMYSGGAAGPLVWGEAAAVVGVTI